MTNKERQQELEEMAKQNRRNELDLLLQQKDYMARKVVFELAGIIREEFPDVAMPEYEKYLPIEEQARAFRTEKNELE